MKASNESNYFVELSKINVNEHVERKGQFSNLSWPFAVSQLRQFDPTAIWEVKRFAGLPYLATDLGVFVELAVTVQGICLSQIHPVLDSKNRPIPIPTTFDINTPHRSQKLTRGMLKNLTHLLPGRGGLC
jgi:hypothetical protein